MGESGNDVPRSYLDLTYNRTFTSCVRVPQGMPSIQSSHIVIAVAVTSAQSSRMLKPITTVESRNATFNVIGKRVFSKKTSAGWRQVPEKL